jgi:hypothetical protein
MEQFDTRTADRWETGERVLCLSSIYLNFHYELNHIEYYLAAVKRLEKTVLEAMDSVCIKTIRRLQTVVREAPPAGVLA